MKASGRDTLPQPSTASLPPRSQAGETSSPPPCKQSHRRLLPIRPISHLFRGPSHEGFPIISAGHVDAESHIRANTRCSPSSMTNLYVVLVFPPSSFLPDSTFDFPLGLIASVSSWIIGILAAIVVLAEGYARYLKEVVLIQMGSSASVHSGKHLQSGNGSRKRCEGCGAGEPHQNTSPLIASAMIVPRLGMIGPPSHAMSCVGALVITPASPVGML